MEKGEEGGGGVSTISQYHLWILATIIRIPPSPRICLWVMASRIIIRIWMVACIIFIQIAATLHVYTHMCEFKHSSETSQTKTRCER